MDLWGLEELKRSIRWIVSSLYWRWSQLKLKPKNFSPKNKLFTSCQIKEKELFMSCQMHETAIAKLIKTTEKHRTIITHISKITHCSKSCNLRKCSVTFICHAMKLELFITNPPGPSLSATILLDEWTAFLYGSLIFTLAGLHLHIPNNTIWSRKYICDSCEIPFSPGALLSTRRTTSPTWSCLLLNCHFALLINFGKYSRTKRFQK